MTDKNYREFFQRAALAFPRIAEFFIFTDFTTKRELTDQENAQRHSIWKRTLLPLNIDDCDKALAEMVDGKLQGPGFDPSSFPAQIRLRAVDIANQRARQAANDRQRKELATAKPWTMRSDLELSRAFMFVTERIGDMRGRPISERRNAIADVLDEIWPEPHGHPALPGDWEPANAADKCLLQKATEGI